MRFRSSLSLLLAVSAIAAAAPRAEAAPPTPSASTVPTIALTPRETPVVSLAIAPAAESLPVYLLAQLIVPDSITRDSVALVAFIRHAATVQVAAFAAADVGLYRGTAFTRSSNLAGSNTSSLPDSLSHPPNRQRADNRSVTVASAVKPPVRSRRLTLAAYARS